ncbi:hypothetical protein F9C07_9309 [Aspergillus flavus]|uniref:DUF7703 domain-containing protein n=1 Tax=Aspergillus flavus (strain ATCC 200026 / FGSC A1120 / IAM 13836 / NRRL 3357 / JCM 12722 / SRRC 167) TaxID=332952 RepID=A0A7G5KC90_ASPFN|nr:uncharacterized protein G4B84_008875 [Aspergillus flavus NRRL3357]QMW45482.1 hypothetical protein G4B11_008902 [Aspergillus flavus]KAF7616369.1 hypothetical protein AFLA_009866 [Aspergillus flavus NRRL3357]QMW33444.1 hypothetical protein G4B84_008875 [Aspergillus flavus NRRL3357]QRD85054.1 hypothetical protein F9C07_9309 [Aspergillus flavus]RAQ69384.1 hypothetical protein COH20_006535 [Aspergillus flavus]
MSPDPDPGLIQPKTGGVTKLQTYIITVFATIAWYNAVELVIICLTTFKRYRGCYFWSLLIASFGLIPLVLGWLFFIFYFGLTRWVSASIIIPSWYCVVAGHSLVLWSRLHLIMQAPKVLRALLILIIVDSVLLFIPPTVMFYGILIHDEGFRTSARFAAAYNVMERIQLVGFCLQELLISGIYIFETTKLLRLRPDPVHSRILIRLVVINVVVMILDVAVVAVQFAGYIAIQMMFKPVAYSIKLKLEYAVLSQLIQISKGPNSDPEQLCSCSQEHNSTSTCRSDSGRNGTADSDMRQYSVDTITTVVSPRQTATY